MKISASTVKTIQCCKLMDTMLSGPCDQGKYNTFVIVDMLPDHQTFQSAPKQQTTAYKNAKFRY